MVWGSPRLAVRAPTEKQRDRTPASLGVQQTGPRKCLETLGKDRGLVFAINSGVEENWHLMPEGWA